MTNAELRLYLSEHRNEEAIFSEALEVLLSQKKDEFKYTAPQTMSYEEVETIFKEKFNPTIYQICCKSKVNPFNTSSPLRVSGSSTRSTSAFGR
jgi:predicted CopG family antitoxin